MPFARHDVGTRQRHARALVLTHDDTQEGGAAAFAGRGGAQGRVTGGGTTAVRAPWERRPDAALTTGQEGQVRKHTRSVSFP